MRTKVKWLAGLATLAAVAGIIWLAGSKPAVAADGGGGWPVTQVALTAVERLNAPRAFHGVGEFEAVRQVVLASETAGRITHIAFTSGQAVKKGELLVQLNDAPEQADRLRLQAQWRNAEKVLARTHQLLSEQVATQEQLDNAQADHDMALGDLRRIEAVIAQKAIRAPFPGVVGVRRVHEGQYLNAGEGIANLVDATALHVNFALDEQAVPLLSPGLPVEVEISAWPERVFVAEVTAIDPLVSDSRTVWVQARVPNDEGALQAGMFAKVRVKRAQATPVLAVPETAVTYTAYGQSVFVAAPDETQTLRVRRVAVKTGERWDGKVEIASGLQAGDQVVVSGQIKLSDGMQVVPVAQNALNESATANSEESAR
ncbi:efflux transporter periplasmic adaptor subunit [Cephaloticoccus primus]|uniref:Efflux transporter periplasmic adaptor subunit n=1 Tax=Cephaloticoccus primus TaxID=1548207 RepID=A0A139SSR0_9BACT|nr:efflux RND transporter periplasmic adaptor subunit [Cephaloticoccus primus]KXU37618.1 efflux transporter periplasmic adaptor subunit [Cephaloticoccus primus]